MANLLDLAKGLPAWLILGFGMLTAGLRTAWSFIYEHTIGYVIARISISLTVEDNDHRDAYIWLNSWVESNLRTRKINSLLLRTHQDYDESPQGDNLQFQLIPGYGTYYLKYRKRLMMVEHRKENHSGSRHSGPHHSVQLQIWFTQDRRRLLDIIAEAKTSYEQSRPARIEYFRTGPYGDWNGSTIAARSIESLFHPEALVRDLFEDVRTFLNSRGIYEELGIPYRRGYLLGGPPGTGKSSLILAVASQFRLPIYSVQLRGKEMTGERVALLLSSCRKPSLIALEDIDCVKVATTRQQESSEELTIADLLNVIDGIGANEDRVLFMTANHPEALNAALTRAGRVDRKFYIDYARDDELRSFHARILKYYPVRPWPEFRAELPEKATIADAQALAFQRGTTT